MRWQCCFWDFLLNCIFRQRFCCWHQSKCYFIMDNQYKRCFQCVSAIQINSNISSTIRQHHSKFEYEKLYIWQKYLGCERHKHYSYTYTQERCWTVPSSERWKCGWVLCVNCNKYDIKILEFSIYKVHLSSDWEYFVFQCKKVIKNIDLKGKL